MISLSNNGKPCHVQGFLLLCGTVLLLIGCSSREKASNSGLITLSGKAQGTTFTIKYRDSLQRDLSGPIDSLLNVVDRSMSLWDSTSTVTQFNAAPDTFQSTDQHFKTVFALSQNLWRSTNNAFDPTVLPVVKAWGVGKSGRGDLDTASVAGLRQLVGMDKLRMEQGPLTHGSVLSMISYFRALPGIQFDPNGIAQGYSVDLITFLLQQAGITNYMVEVGGETRCSGQNDKGTPWLMQIDKPVDGPQHEQQTVVPLEDKSLATSGNYRKFIEVGGKRYGHTIDPRTCRPAMNALLSASVIADDCATADALGTALMVMGPDEGKEWLAQHPEVEAYLVIDDGAGGYMVWSTPGWPKSSIQ